MIKRVISLWLPVTAVLIWVASGAAASAPQVPTVDGAWTLIEYQLASGETHPLAGTIFFVAGRWQVAFFVLDAEGRPQRASAEGGTYSVRGRELVFRHELNFAFGAGLPGLPASDPTMTLRSSAGAASEPVQLGWHDDRMTIDFPSGNRIVFERFAGSR